MKKGSALWDYFKIRTTCGNQTYRFPLKRYEWDEGNSSSFTNKENNHLKDSKCIHIGKYPYTLLQFLLNNTRKDESKKNKNSMENWKFCFPNTIANFEIIYFVQWKNICKLYRYRYFFISNYFSVVAGISVFSFSFFIS